MKLRDDSRRTANTEALEQDERADLIGEGLLDALKEGYLIAPGDDPALMNTYLALMNSYHDLCSSARRPYVAGELNLIDLRPGKVAVQFAGDADFPGLVRLATSLGAGLEVDASLGALTIEADWDAVEETTVKLARLIWRPHLGGESARQQVSAYPHPKEATDTGVILLSPIQVPKLIRALASGIFELEPGLAYPPAREDRP